MSEHTETFETELTIRSVQGVYTKLHDQLVQGNALILDTGKLIQVDTAGAQMLYLLARLDDSGTHKLTWKNGSAELQAQLQSLGIEIPALFSDI
ncbi:MAG: STAS domain-containing protein [Shewanella sp.]|nr:STAS domain-containing protein [Shewanella sp.]MCF1430257.1 STAS domain-containing protein [Shewanella sp.]MCF1437950.1 STAS domain-containing protein [Shewanella sp.]MCF1459581.1 STAS domain-containing protein [Shewanella sp.]